LQEKVKSLLALMGAFITLTSAFAADTAPVAIAELHAMPYYPAKGVVRRTTDLFDRRLLLRNIIGEPEGGADPLRRDAIADWDIEFGTTATLVEIQLERRVPDAVAASSLHVVFEARAIDSRRLLARQDVLWDAVAPTISRKWTLPFLVYGTGCEPLRIDVRIVSGNRVVDRKSGSIPFSCGE
jgi:hypothetical protein